MTAYRLPIAASVLGLLMAHTGSAIAQEASAAAARTHTHHKLHFKVGADNCVQKVARDADDADADSTYVSEGDNVTWSFSGPRKRVVFAAASPFDWQDSDFSSGTIQGVVKSGAAQGGNNGSYKYTVNVEGKNCALDPMIIVQN